MHAASVRAQYLDCPISQFHIEWLKAYGQVKRLKECRFKDKILESMETRQQTLMANNAYKAALFLDPRLNFSGSELFSADQKAEIIVITMFVLVYIDFVN